MKHKSFMKHLLSICLCTVVVLVCLFSIAVNADAATIVDSGTCGENVTWTLDSEGTLTISGTGKMEDYYWHESTFRNDSDIKNIVIHNGVTTIGDYAFESCTKLTSLTISSSVTSIGISAFDSCSGLTEVVIPDSVETIESSAFDSCYNLTSMNIGNGVTYIGSDAFDGCKNLQYNTYENAKYLGNSDNPYVILMKRKSKNITSCTIHAKTKFIYQGAFSACDKLTSIKIPEGVLSIGNKAFYSCSSLTEVKIPNSVTMVGFSAFDDCKNLQFNTYDNAKYLGNTDNPYVALIGVDDTSTSSFNIHQKTKIISGAAFCGCNKLSSITIPNSVSTIGHCAFQACESLTQVMISNSVTRIGWHAFSDCINLKKINIPDSVVNIGGYAFYNCNSLTSITIPDSVTSIENWTFNYCTNLTDVYIGRGVDSIKTGAFSHCDNLATVVISDGVKHIGCSAFYNSINLSTITIPDSVYMIGRVAFCYSGLSELSIPDSVTFIDMCAFYSCNNLTSVTIGSSVTTIKGYAFEECNKLQNIFFRGDKIESGYASFYNVEAVAYYPHDNATWTNWGLPNLGGKLQWFSYNPIQITSQPEDGYAFEGSTAETTVTAAGDGLNYQWYIKDVNESSYSKSPCDTASYSCEINSKTIGRTAFCVITDKNGSTVVSKMVRFFKKNIVSINAQPKTAYAIVGDIAKTTVKASGDGLTYQWYVKDIGDTKYYKSSIAKATYSCKMSSTTNGRYAKCKITDQYGNSMWTNTVRLKIKDLAITTQPVSKTVKDGVTAKFMVKPNGTNVTYQWQYRTSSKDSWKNASATGNKTKTLSVAATTAKHGYQYRCRITDSAGNKIYSKTVTLNVLGVKTQPVNKTVVAGKTAKFTVAATGKSLKYQWQYRTSSSGSWKNTTATGCKTKTLSISATAAKHGYQYRCKITDSAGNVIYTKEVSMYVLGIKTQPVNKTVKAGATAKFTVKAVGKGLTYQWQYKTPSAGSWKNVSAASGKTASYSLTAQSRHNGYQYRCKITDSAGNVIYSNIVKLTVK